MQFVKISLSGVFCLVILCPVFSQTKDSSVIFSLSSKTLYSSGYKKKFPVKAFILPTLAIGYGFATLGSNGLKSINNEVKEEIWLEGPQEKTKIDNYLQWSPAVLVYGLNVVGIHGKNNFRDRSMIYLLSQLFMNVSVTSLKHITHQQRPDGSDFFSFPSGHTANAFLGAEFMWREYKDVSVWLAGSGYLMAAATGYLRMYNNKHWLSDVVAGAGIGVASTKLAYWLYPKIRHVLFRDKLPNTAILPFYQNHSFGIGLVKQF